MSNKMDKLFKEKLEGHSLQPSAQAWDKVEAHLGKKNKMVLWARVAAAVILLGLLTFAGVNWNSGDTKEDLAKESGTESREPEVKEQETKQEPTPVENRKEIKKQKAQPKVVAPVIGQTQEQVAIVPEQEVEPEPASVETQLTTHNSQSATQKGITLTYSLPAIRKQEAPTDPVVAEQPVEPKKSGFERVMEIAKEVKTGEALGELRQAKDDIFALDFRKDKNKKQ